MILFPGKIVLYRWRAGQVRAGQTESAAMITRVNQDGSANLKIFADDPNGDLWFKSVPPLSETVTTHCWLLTPDERGTQQTQMRFDPKTKRVAV